MRPSKFVNAQTDRAAGKPQRSGDKQLHAHRGGMPSAGDEALENALFSGGVVQMERLWIKTGGKLQNFVLGHPISVGFKTVADSQILQIFFVHSILAFR